VGNPFLKLMKNPVFVHGDIHRGDPTRSGPAVRRT
jgi:hypothetical protein